MLRFNEGTLESLGRELAAHPLVTRLIDLARDEDLGPPGAPGSGDATSLACPPAAGEVAGNLVFREGGIASGLALIPAILTRFAPNARWMARIADGTDAPPGTIAGVLHGPRDQVLAAERTILNLVGRLSGVAMRTARFVREVGPGVRARVYDTRKTTPGLRLPEKYAVRCGGGLCHRLGLHDAVLIKDNHLAGLGPGAIGPFVEAAARRARTRVPAPAFVEVEAGTLDQLREILAIAPGLVDVVLLDNMAPGDLARGVRMRDETRPGLSLEASGGVRLESIRQIAATGVDRISVGSLTHGASWLDVALDVHLAGTG